MFFIEPLCLHKSEFTTSNFPAPLETIQFPTTIRHDLCHNSHTGCCCLLRQQHFLLYDETKPVQSHHRVQSSSPWMPRYAFNVFKINAAAVVCTVAVTVADNGRKTRWCKGRLNASVVNKPKIVTSQRPTAPIHVAGLELITVILVSRNARAKSSIMGSARGLRGRITADSFRLRFQSTSFHEIVEGFWTHLR